MLLVVITELFNVLLTIFLTSLKIIDFHLFTQRQPDIIGSSVIDN